MIDFYTWKTPNGYKISIMLEETKMPYTVHPVDISKKEQFTEAFLKLNPNHKIPVMVDQNGPHGKPLTIVESGAILIYLAEKSGQLLSADPIKRMLALQWLIFQVSGLGPMLGQAHHFLHYAPEKVPYAVERYTNEAKRLYGILNKRLTEVEYLAEDYSIADIACYPWITYHKAQNINLDEFPQVKRWFEAIAARPAVQIGMQIPK